MVTTRAQALEIAGKVRAGLEGLYGPRLRGVYLYGSAARSGAVLLSHLHNRLRWTVRKGLIYP